MMIWLHDPNGSTVPSHETKLIRLAEANRAAR